MCGVVAIFHHDPAVEISAAIIKKMNQQHIHRGPDEQNIYIEPGLALGHTRLSIIDLKEGQQPLQDIEQQVTISFNGEIYNYKALRAELIELGYQFKTHSDTEVIVNAWKAWHVHCVEKFNGMFAFVLWDSAKQQCFAARDRLGIKPLHYIVHANKSVSFSSEIKGLKQLPEIILTLNEQAIEDYFSLGYVIEPKSIYKEVLKLPAGHYLLIERGKPFKAIPTCYWQVEHFFAEQTEVDIQQGLTLLQQAVKRRLVSDVEVGAFLSGGIDSTTIVALMVQLGTQQIKTCSIGFDLSAYDESAIAEQVAQYYSTDHSSTNVSVNDLALVDKLIELFDEPFADNAAIPTYILSQVTRQRVKVALSGDGSDELFLGYRNYQMLYAEQIIRKIIPATIRKPVFTFLATLYPKLSNAPRFLRAKTTLLSLAQDEITSYHHSVSITSQSILQNLYHIKLKEKLAGYSSLQVFQQLAKKVSVSSWVKTAQYIDFKTYLSGDILTKIDRASMAASLEVRVPFLDHTVVEWGLSLAESTNLSLRKVKKVLVLMVRSIVPDFIIARKKMGFSSPVDEWIRKIPEETILKRILTPQLLALNIINATSVETLVYKHQHKIENHGMTIWSLLIFEAFLRKQYETNP
jgi:asparagine synthase (glutamine-hydrolysing)